MRLTTATQALCATLTALATIVLAAPDCGADGRVRIASIYSRTGVAARTNQPAVRGVRQAVADVNGGGGVLGKKLVLLEFDNKSTAIGSKVAAEKAANADVSAIIGAMWSTHSLAIARVAQDRGIPMMTGSSTSPKVTRIGAFIFRACYTDTLQGTIMAAFARQDLAADSAAVVLDVTSDYSLELGHEFQSQFQSLGGTVSRVLHYKYKQENFARVVRQLLPADPDVLFIPGYDASAVIIREARAVGLRAIPLGADGWGNESFFKKGGSALEGYFCTHWSPDDPSPRSRQFVRRYAEAKPPTPAQALAYDALLLVVDAIRRADSTDRRPIRDALADTEGFQGVTGTFSFNEHGDPIKSAVIMKLKGNRAELVRRISPE